MWSVYFLFTNICSVIGEEVATEKTDFFTFFAMLICYVNYTILKTIKQFMYA